MAKTELELYPVLEHALQDYGYWPQHAEHFRVVEEERNLTCSKCGHKGKAKIKIEIPPFHPGRPDIDVRHPRKGRFFFMEAKTIRADELSFSFSKISESQRKYIKNWCKEGGRVFIAIGKLLEVPNGRSWHSIRVLEWTHYIEQEDRAILAGANSIPWDLSLYKKMPTELFDFNTLFGAWTLLAKDEHNNWHFHPEHPITQGLELVEHPYYERVREKA